MTITNSNGNIYTIKCLKVLAHCELKNMVLVDDNPFSYLYNQNNGIPILPYRGDCKDK